MPLISELPSQQLTKSMCIAESGTGKTGALASLANAGYTLAIADFDKGTQVLMDPGIMKPEARSRVYVETFIDKVVGSGAGIRTLGAPTAYTRFTQCLDNWPGLGPVSKFTNRHVLVVDSGTFLGDACMKYTLFANGKLQDIESGKRRISLPDWGGAIDLEERIFELLYSDAIPCHVIANFHTIYLGGEEQKSQEDKNSDFTNSLAAIANIAGANVVPANVAPPPPLKIFPSALGRKLPTKLGRYFNTVVSLRSGGDKRLFVTRSMDGQELKVPCPSKIPATLPISEGWLKIFQAIESGS